MNNTRHQEMETYLKRNEQKSRIRLISWVVLCLCLGLLTTYLGYDSQQKNKQIDEQNRILQRKNDSLKVLGASRDSLLKHIDTLKKAINNRTNIKEKIAKLEISGYVVYIQRFGTNSKEAAKMIQNALIVKGYAAPGVEKIEKTFKSKIIYFQDEDRVVSNNIYEVVKKVILKFEPNYDIEQLKPYKIKIDNPPLKQIEVWINL